MGCTVEYVSNNSGGSWWLEDKDWENLEAAGWIVDWCRDKKDKLHIDGDRWLGALATSATKRNTTLREAISEFERITRLNAASEGCQCCGPPHSFREEDESGKALQWVSGGRLRQR
jgi:hypothetical protein